ncbi:hypothetical protein GCM10020367_51000 [Streptomyces sannanensis]|uniref:Uncharacterized protein n=1 Tax=Streptomyces sannanensis TaxID=285536 RepID=A0ABP6SI83_9ACTN
MADAPGEAERGVGRDPLTDDELEPAERLALTPGPVRGRQGRRRRTRPPVPLPATFAPSRRSPGYLPRLPPRLPPPATSPGYLPQLPPPATAGGAPRGAPARRLAASAENPRSAAPRVFGRLAIARTGRRSSTGKRCRSQHLSTDPAEPASEADAAAPPRRAEVRYDDYRTGRLITSTGNLATGKVEATSSRRGIQPSPKRAELREAVS